MLLCPGIRGQEKEEILRTDTLSTVIYFPVSRDDRVYMEYGGNQDRLEVLKREVALSEDNGGRVTNLNLRGSASPEGPTDFNTQLGMNRAATAREFLVHYLDLRPSVVASTAVGEDWEGFLEQLDSLEGKPWRDTVLVLIRDEATRKERIKNLDNGMVWHELLNDGFLRLRAVRCHVVIVYPKPKVELQKDTVYVDVPYEVEKIVTVPVAVPEEKPPYPGEGKKMLFALRTNTLAIPFTNIGVEVPLGEHWSLGADWYSPWIWRERHSENLDTWGWGFEFQALDLEARYWFTNPRKRPEQRLLGHSIGLYAAAGHYDFERDWKGNQGEFGNIGIDYLYALPLFKGRMHLELELGLGFIYSRNQAYLCITHGDKCYRYGNGKRAVTWLGPTRAQISFVVPIYVKTRKNN